MHSTALGQPLLVPEGTRLLHIGPPKTATTTVQRALNAARDDLLAQGVRYVGQRRRQARALAGSVTLAMRSRAGAMRDRLVPTSSVGPRRDR
jgi:hypothetical protein